MKVTKNTKQLVIQKMSVDAIPSGTGLDAGLKFLSSKESVMAGYRAAVAWVEQAIHAVRSASEPNPWKNADDDTIAAEILRRIKERDQKVK